MTLEKINDSKVKVKMWRLDFKLQGLTSEIFTLSQASEVYKQEAIVKRH